MSITDHPGFRRAVAEARLTGRHASEIFRAIEAIEADAVEWFRFAEVECPVRERFAQGPETGSEVPHPVGTSREFPASRSTSSEPRQTTYAPPVVIVVNNIAPTSAGVES